MRTSAYRSCGGYEALRLTIVDDIKLGLLLHRAGARTRAFLGGADVECHWGTTVPHMFKIMEKNYFAAVDFRLAPVVAGAMVFTAVVNSAVVTLRQGGVRWRDTFYSLDTLRRGNVSKRSPKQPCKLPRGVKNRLQVLGYQRWHEIAGDKPTRKRITARSRRTESARNGPTTAAW